MPRVAVCLSGCGFLDGTEIHEAVCTLLALDQAGADILCCAPDIPQADVIDHTKQAPAPGESRNVLVESARIARGQIRDLASVQADEIDALIFPGGFGAAKNLCTFATDGADCKVHPEVERLVGQMLSAGKPVGAICIAPAMIARITGKKNIRARLTIGTDKDTAAAIHAMGAQHCDCQARDIVVDEQHKIVSTPAYMLAQGPADVFEGVRKLVEAVLKMA